MLTSGPRQMFELPDRDFSSPQPEPSIAIAEKTKKADIFTFPKGVKAGNFWHEIFEHHDFTCPDPHNLDMLVNTKLAEYDFSADWKDVVTGTVGNVLNLPLDTKGLGFNLSTVSPNDRLNELEFYFPLKPITVEKIRAIFAAHDRSGITDGFPEAIGRLNFSPIRGFMKGYIDLVFTHQNRYYLVDWKSNYLGNKPEDYDQNNLHKAMKRSFYFLQYHIYVIALNKYLSIRQPGYDYKKHFGGVYYIFLRGVDPKSDDGYGVYFDLPSGKLITELTDNLITKPDQIQL